MTHEEGMHIPVFLLEIYLYIENSSFNFIKLFILSLLDKCHTNIIKNDKLFIYFGFVIVTLKNITYDYCRSKLSITLF